MEYISMWMILIGVVLVAISYLFYQTIDAKVTAMEIRLKDETVRLQSNQNAVNMLSDAVRDIRLKMKDTRDTVEMESEAVDKMAQEVIRLDREMSRLRPMVKVVLAKEVVEKKAKNKTH